MNKSEVRKRVWVVSVRLTPDECDVLTRAAEGMGVSSFLREAALADARGAKGKVSGRRTRIALLRELVVAFQPMANAAAALAKRPGQEAAIADQLLVNLRAIRQLIVAVAEPRRS
jgi:uncharacterized protein (DUF1778 family)